MKTPIFNCYATQNGIELCGEDVVQIITDIDLESIMIELSDSIDTPLNDLCAALDKMGIKLITMGIVRENS